MVTEEEIETASSQGAEAVTADEYTRFSVVLHSWWSVFAIDKSGATLGVARYRMMEQIQPVFVLQYPRKDTLIETEEKECC